MKLNAQFHHKQSEFNTNPAVVEKIIEIPQYEFMSLCRAPMKDRAFITENIDLMRRDAEGVYHCLLVLGERCDDGILIEAEGYDYARKSAFMPGARQVVYGSQQYECLKRFEKSMNDAADELISCARAHYDDGNEESFRAGIEEICDGHDVGVGNCSLLVDLVLEREPTFDIEIDDDEIIISRVQPEQAASPISPERTAEILDKALDWIGEMESRGDLYDTLKNTIGMSDEEITAAGFELSDYFDDPDEEESSGMTMQ